MTSAARVGTLPQLELPEFAFIGRSNVGKSSLLGMVLRRPKLVRTSRTPGRTQLINLFSFEDRMLLADLPGYGYAALSKEKRAAMQRMIHEYLEQRLQLRGVVQLLDARREEVSEEDRGVAEWVLAQGKQLLVVLTKIDLIPKNRRRHQAQLIEASLGVPRGCALTCSAETGEGRAELVARLGELCK